jgi:hypothetical protein
VSLLTIAQDVCDLLSFSRPSVVVTSTDKLVRQVFAMINAAGEALSKEGDPGWQSLTAEWTFITTATPEQTNTPIPPDLRRFNNDSFFNRTTQRPVYVLNSQEWQLVQSRPFAASIFMSFRERSGSFLAYPDPPAGQTVAYEYISSYWAKSSAGQPKARFTSDDDTTFLDEELLKLGTIWRVKQAKGLDYGEDLVSYERELARALGADGAKGSVSIAGPLELPPGAVNVAEGNWPG